MRFASLGSGSKGNATLVECGDTCLLVDCGFSIRETVKRLARLERSPEQLSAILVTHEHGDHLKGVMPLSRRYKIPVYLTAGTAKAGKVDEPSVNLIESEQTLILGGVEVQPVAVPHDAREPVQYLFKTDRHCLGVLTDLGSVTPHVVESYRNCDALLLEANHDLQMLASGPYPQSLKRRVSSHWGHLNNIQCADLLSQVERSRLQHLVLGHISLKNNTVEKVQAAVSSLVSDIKEVHYACQDEGFGWLQLV